MMREEQFSAAIGDWSLPLPHRRFGIYRNNVASALINALRVRYPVTDQLVGPAFFNAMAGAYAEIERPSSAVLIDYGGSFPDFIQGFEPAARVPYLSDVARLESLWWRAYHAADAAPLATAAFATVPAEAWSGMRFDFHPSMGLIRTSHAALPVWQAHHGGPGMKDIVIDAPQRILVARPHSSVDMRPLAAAAFDFMSALNGDACLADAVDHVASIHPGFDLHSQLQGLIALNIITGLRP